MTFIEQCRAKIERAKDYPIEFVKEGPGLFLEALTRLEKATMSLKDSCFVNHAKIAKELEKPIECEQGDADARPNAL